MRFSAVELAMPAKPLPRLVSAELIALMTEVEAAIELSFCCACCQKFWSCCQNEVELPMLLVLIEPCLVVAGDVAHDRAQLTPRVGEKPLLLVNHVGRYWSGIWIRGDRPCTVSATAATFLWRGRERLQVIQV